MTMISIVMMMATDWRLNDWEEREYESFIPPWIMNLLIDRSRANIHSIFRLIFIINTTLSFPPFFHQFSLSFIFWFQSSSSPLFILPESWKRAPQIMTVMICENQTLIKQIRKYAKGIHHLISSCVSGIIILIQPFGGSRFIISNKMEG